MSVYGIDCSHWDGAIDWLRIRQDGRVKFVIMKATEATYFVDDRFVANKAGCQLIGMPWAAYHYFRPAYDAVQQAQFFKQTVGAGCHVYVIDVEAGGADLGNKVKAFLDALDVPKKLIYTGPYFWRDNVGVNSWAASYDLWIANYGVQQPMIPLPWNNYKIWQYNDRGQVAGINANVDEDLFNGDQAAMLAYFGNGNATPEPPDDEIKPQKYVVVTAGALNMRSLPSASSKDIGTLAGGDDLPVLEEINGWYRVEGWINGGYTRAK